jgi:S1-C subfamily serine protease
MICRSRELAYAELAYVIAYQALREASTPAVRKAMVDDANALVVAINEECNIPTKGVLLAAPTETNVQCIKERFERQRLQLIARLSGVAREEGILEPAEAVAIQRGLQAKSYLPATADIDGVFGPMSRQAILAWQRDTGLPETGFGSRAMLAILNGRPQGSTTAGAAPAPTPPAAPSAPPFQIDRSGKTSSIRLALAEGPDLRAQDVFQQVSQAVYVVRTLEALGSAVAISERELLTNCHIMKDAPVAILEREGVKLAAVLVSADRETDRCVLQVSVSATLPKWVGVRPYADVKVGERVFTIGSPQGLELSLAEGLVSSKRTVDAGRLIQTTAPISSGSSGGGLFDVHGHLIGITTFMLKNSQNLNFAIAAEEYAK